MGKHRKLSRRSQSTDNQAAIKTSRIKTYQVNPKKFAKDELTRDILEAQKKARENKKYKKVLNKMQIEVKTSNDVMELIDTVRNWGFNRNDIFTFFKSCENEKIDASEFQKVRFKDSELKLKLTSISKLKSGRVSGENYGAKIERLKNAPNSTLNIWLNGAGSKPLLNLSHRGTIWVVPVCDADATDSLAKIITRNHVEILRENLKRLITSWRKQLFPESQPERHIGTNPDYKQTAKYIVALDCEWVSEAKHIKRGKSPVSVRNLDNVLSFQLTAYNPLNAKKHRLTIHNDTKQHFQWSELLRGLLSVIAPIAEPNEDGSIAKNMQITLLTYYGGVDASCFGGWETKLHDLMVLHKNFIFSSRYLPFKVFSEKAMASRAHQSDPLGNEFKLSMRFVDVGLVAPQGGLKALGRAVGSPKIDTEVWDVEDGEKKGFYKSHMDVLRVRRPDDYLAYAQLDADITLEYYLQAISLPFFSSWESKPPATIGSFGASLVFNLLKKDDKNACELIFNNNLSSGDIANSKGVMGVKTGQADLFKMATEAFFGGFNVAFTSGLYYRRILDYDAVSAYNVAGLCISRVNYDKHDYLVLKDSQIGKKWLDNPVKLTKDNSFKKLYKLLESNPFVIGVVNVQIDMPDDCKFTTIPFQSTNKDFGPCYVKHGVTTVPLLDAFNAMRMGGDVKLIDGYIPAQDFNGLSAFGQIQAECLGARNEAKKRKKIAKKEGDERGYNRAEVEQQLYKLTANSIYGKTGQGTSSTKRARDFDTNDTEDINYSSITNPLIAAQYTSITRFIVSLIFESIEHTCKDVIPLNITTDGYSFGIPVNASFDEDAARDYFLSVVPDLYKKRCAEHFGGVVNGFEKKGDVVDQAFNLKTRVNGTVHYDDSNGGIHALASMRGHSSSDIYNLILNKQYQVVNKEMRMTNITELKHHVRNHYGHQETWEQQKVVGLQYDYAYKPEQYIDDSNGDKYITTLPFSTVEEHDAYKKLGMMLGRVFPIASCSSNFQAFVSTMNSKNLSIRKTDVNMENFAVYCLKNYLAVHQDEMSNKQMYELTDAYKLSRSTIRNYLSRHDVNHENVNYLASWYFEHQEDFKSCESGVTCYNVIKK